MKRKSELLLCPLSVELLLSLSLYGAKGSTAEELARGLFVPNDTNRLKGQIQMILGSISKIRSTTISATTKLFLNKGFALDPKYLDIAVNVFKTNVETLDLSNKTKAVDMMDKWVAKQTNNRVQKLIDWSEEHPQMVMVNTIYVKGKWGQNFKVLDAKFSSYQQRRAEGPKEGLFSVPASVQRINTVFLELPFEGNDIYLTVMLPPKEGASLSEKFKNKWRTDKTKPEGKIQDQVPMFEGESTIDFIPILEEMGMFAPFSPFADFSNIGAKKETLMFSNVLQKTYINVSENGTETTAVSAAQMVSLAMAQKRVPRQIITDNPLIYIMRSKIGLILFVGCYR